MSESRVRGLEDLWLGLANERSNFPPLLMEASGRSHRRVHHKSTTRISSDCCDTTGSHSEVPKSLVPSSSASEGDCPEKSAGLPLVWPLSFCVSLQD